MDKQQLESLYRYLTQTRRCMEKEMNDRFDRDRLILECLDRSIGELVTPLDLCDSEIHLIRGASQ